MSRFFSALRPVVTDFLSTIAFIALYAITGSIVVGVVTGMAVGVAQIGWLLFQRRKIDLMQWASLALVIVLGGATLLTHDPRFVMIKPSIGLFAIGCVMLRPGWIARYLPPIVTGNLSPRVPLVWGYVWAGLEFILAAANLVVAFGFGLKAWTWYTAFVPTVAQLGLFALQYLWMRALVTRNIRARLNSSPA